MFASGQGGQPQLLGTVVNSCACCEYQFECFNAAQQRLFLVEAECWSCGIWCCCPAMDKCRCVQFVVNAGFQKSLVLEKVLSFLESHGLLRLRLAKAAERVLLGVLPR